MPITVIKPQLRKSIINSISMDLVGVYLQYTHIIKSGWCTGKTKSAQLFRVGLGTSQIKYQPWRFQWLHFFNFLVFSQFILFEII